MNVFIYKRLESLVITLPKESELATSVSELMFDLQEVLATAKIRCDTRKGAIGRILKRFCYIIAVMFLLSQHKILC